MSAIDTLPRTAAEHFRLHVYAAILGLRGRLPEPDDENGLAFLRGYYDELAAAGFAQPATGDVDRWWELVHAWEPDASIHLPLRALRDAYALDPTAMTLLFTAGLVDEDVRFGALFEALTRLQGEPRPTVGLLSTWSDDGAARDAILALLAAGVLAAANPDAPRSRWALEVPPVLWDAMRGRPPGPDVAWVQFRPPEELPRIDRLVLPDDLVRVLERAPEVVDGPLPRPLVVRGPRSGGRRTIVGAVARRLGRGLLELRDPAAAERLAGPLAKLLNALPLVELDPAPGETVVFPSLGRYAGPRAAIAGRRGGIRAERAVTLTIGLPDPDRRAVLWRSALGDAELADDVVTDLRIPAGTIHRLADLARGEAALEGRATPTSLDVRAALRSLEAETLETLATRVPLAGDWDDLAIAPETARELELLEARCRNRERLHEGVGAALGAQLTAGVRALFSGPSGTGKTLAARLLASALGKELFSVDLATVVNKYLGETEKNLDAVFSRAEELDVVLMLDEGDALMTRRTDVKTSNDRYANLETNFLLQRLESYEGILVVTTNAGERIDDAFKRRLDVVVEFRAPDAPERWSIWQLHLPPEHDVDAAYLDEVAARCQLTGGQIRNAVLHASLLALDARRPIDSGDLETGVRREYRKVGGICPLQQTVPLGA